MSRLIDADKLKKDVLDLPNCYNGFSDTYDKARIIGVIDEQPTIGERETGEWIIEPYDVQNDIFVHRCGVCMRVAMLGGNTTRFHYCPLCGSFMEGEQPRKTMNVH